MVFDDYLMDAKLHIETTGRDDTCSSGLIFPYEPVSYSVLSRLAEKGYITGNDHLVDYGSGKGRAVIYLSDRTGCRATGVELVRRFHMKACQNLRLYLDQYDKENVLIEFINMKAQDYVLPETVNRLFFFNPFHFKILKQVMSRVLQSYGKDPRHIRMFFYYPQNAYITYIKSLPKAVFVDEIDCTDLFEEKDEKNKVTVFDII